MPAASTFPAILARLVSRYRSITPDIERIGHLLVADAAVTSGAGLGNDHIAFRTFGLPAFGIASLEPLLLHYGYVRRDAFHFSTKHVDACWFAPPLRDLPRVFISELRLNDMSPRSSNIIRSLTQIRDTPLLDDVDLDDCNAVVNVLQSQLWTLPRLDEYRQLSAESEYAAWTIMNGYLLNHITLSVHDLRPNLQSIKALNGYLKARGIVLNESGGEIKISPDGLLLQSSTIAHQRTLTFADGRTASVAGPYVEFAERRVLPQFAHIMPLNILPEHRRDGFETANADRIFESTNVLNAR